MYIYIYIYIYIINTHTVRATRGCTTWIARRPFGNARRPFGNARRPFGGARRLSLTLNVYTYY